ncbi:MAG TPA: flavodoxin family protein [Aggregatilineaceae bacterium]|nr:flavodoxin family protein [Aggregatilineaceae bacterium]
MKILVLLGSYRRNGNTDQLTGLIKEHLQQEAEQRNIPLEIETIYLGQQNLQFCRGCRICYDRGEEHCPLKDDLLAIKAKMLAADGVLMASPVYVDDVSGITKSFIDRLCHVCHRPQFAGKTAYVIATTGSSRTGKTLDTMKMALRVWGFNIAGQSGYKMGALMKREDTRAQLDARAARDAHQLFQSIVQKRYNSPSFYSLMMFKIQQSSWQTKGEPGTVDYQYWQEQGWFDPRHTFYFPHQANAFKVALARLTGTVIGKFMA